MTLIILGDKQSNYNGILTAIFKHDNNDQYVLKFDLESWKDVASNGYILDNHIDTFNPEQMRLKFDFEYTDISVEYARKIYRNLVTNGWSA